MSRLAELDPDAIAREIARQLDTGPWRRERDRDGVAVYSCSELPCPHTGFRTVTEHAADIDELTRFLGDGLLDAFSEMNDRYVEGAELRRVDDSLRVVRTSFSMPPPLANREFVHMLYVTELDPDTRIIAYQSVDDADLPPPQDGFVRCPIYPSGQRLTRLPLGGTRVEHLMVYDLAGRISPGVQNRVFHGGHVGAYYKEWRALMDRFGERAWQPMSAAEVDLDALIARLGRDLDRSSSWPAKASKGGVRVSTGFLPGIPCRAYRSDTVLDADLGAVVRLIADDMVEQLPAWNREFDSGEVLDVLADERDRKAWLVRVAYRTPRPLRDREYLYYAARVAVSPDETIVAYLSVDDPIGTGDGRVRATLYPTVHRCVRLADGRTRVEHILATDVGGALAPWMQSHLFSRGFVAANLRDALAQRALFAPAIEPAGATG